MPKLTMKLDGDMREKQCVLIIKKCSIKCSSILLPSHMKINLMIIYI